MYKHDPLVKIHAIISTLCFSDLDLVNTDRSSLATWKVLSVSTRKS